MTLDEAIKHAEEVAEQNEEDAVIYSNCKNHKKNLYEIGLAENAEKKCCKCAEEHRQLAEWLKELKWLREQTRPNWTPISEEFPRKYKDVLLQFPNNQCVGCYEDGDWMINIGDGIYSIVGDNEEKPIAWMPTPESYKEE